MIADDLTCDVPEPGGAFQVLIRQLPLDASRHHILNFALDQAGVRLELEEVIVFSEASALSRPSGLSAMPA